MSTRSNICVKVGDDSYHCIYCHYDGYPEHHLPILTNYYNTQELAESLVSLGDLSVLGESNKKPDDYDVNTPIDGYCIYYGRDRNEADIGYRVSSFPIAEEEYCYIFENGEWKYTMVY